MRLSEYAALDGLGLAELVRRKEVTPEELVQTALAAIEAVNPSLNAVIGVLEEEARATLARGLPEGPFTGVPFAIKDLFLHAAGVRTDLGSRLFEGVVFPHDTALLARYRRAGIVPVARTNTPELGFNATTEPVLHGPTHNPWNPAYSPGGSSGGSAAAVSAGIIPLAHANDGAGSIRIPAAMCGLFGMKPSRGRTPAGPDVGEPLLGTGIEHVVSRSVRDSAAMLDATAGPDVGNPFHIPSPERPFLKEVEREPGRLRIAVSWTSPSGGAVSPECVAAVQSAAKLCRELGHEVIEAAPAYGFESLQAALLSLWSSSLAGWAYGLAEAMGRTPGPDVLEAATWATVRHGLDIKAMELQNTLAVMNHLARTLGQFFQAHDVLLTPTLPVAPYRLGVLDSNAPTTARAWAERLFSYTVFTAVYNVTGLPAMNVPLHWSDEALPVGVQFGGGWGNEGLLFQLAGQLERARPWARRTPPLHAGAAASSRTKAE